MENKTLFVLPIYWMSFPPHRAISVRFLDKLWITNDPSKAVAGISPKVVASIGTLEYNEIKRSKSIIFGFFEIPESEKHINVLNDILFLCDLFISRLWTVKDNSISFEYGFLIDNIVSKNFFQGQYSKSDGTREIVHFDESELKLIRSFVMKVTQNPAYSVSGEGSPSIDGGAFSFFSGKYDPSVLYDHFDGGNRIGVAYSFVQRARSTPSLMKKISHYVASLEAMFATTSNELASALSQRVALFIGNTYEERMIIYRNMKNLYKYRSKYVHGDQIKRSKREELAQLSITCDSYVRTALLKAMTDGEFRAAMKDNASIEDFFLRRVMS